MGGSVKKKPKLCFVSEKLRIWRGKIVSQSVKGGGGDVPLSSIQTYLGKISMGGREVVGGTRVLWEFFRDWGFRRDSLEDVYWVGVKSKNR